jgi:uncharacterized repeat protein (TIGR01451 family)
MKKNINQKMYLLFINLILINNLFSQECGSYLKPIDTSAIFKINTIYNDQLIFTDRFKNKYNFNELLIYQQNNQNNNPNSGLAHPASYICYADLFSLHFIDEVNSGYGFSLAANRDLVCQVFRDISRLLEDIYPTNPVRVHIYIASDQSIGLAIPGSSVPAGKLGMASAFSTEPIGLSNAFIDNAVYTTIRSGISAYQNISHIPQNSDAFYHGYVVINFNNINWYTNYNSTAISPTQFDLYTTVLHEALHLLGLTSQLDQNGSATNNLFSRYDDYLYRNSISNKVLTYNAITKQITNTSGLTNLATSCATPNNFIFNGTNTTGQAVYTSNAWAPGQSLSHFGCSGTGPCNASYSKPNSDYVLNPCIGSGSSYLKRHPNQKEVYALCDLGYNLKSISSIVAYGENINNDSAAGDVYKMYNTCNTPCIAVGKSDYYTTDYMTSISLNYNTQILNNDIPNSAGASISRIELLDTSKGKVTYTANGFTFIPNLNVTGEVILVYFPICTSSNRLGSLTFITILVASQPLPPCIPDGSCNLICNGGFEETNLGTSLGDFRISIGNTPDIYVTENGKTNIRDNYTGQKKDYLIGSINCSTFKYSPVDTNGEKQYIGIGTGIASQYIEAVRFKLKTPLQANTTYLLSYLSKQLVAGCPPFKILVYGDSTSPCPLPSITNIDGTNSICGFNASLLNDTSISPIINKATWTKYSDTITPTKKITDLILVPFNKTVDIYAYFDNFELTKPNLPLLKIISNASTLSPCISTTNFITYTICLNNTTGSNTVPIPLQLNLPNGINILANSSFNATGQYIIPINTISTSNCITLTLNYSLNQTILPNTKLKIDLKTSNNNYCISSLEKNTITITPITSPITIYKSVNNLSPKVNDTITYTIDICNKSLSSVNNIIISDSIPQGLSIINSNGFNLSGNILTKTINVSAAININLPVCTTFTYTAKLIDGCPIQNCVTAVSASNCVNAQSCISINLQNSYSLNLSPKNLSLCYLGNAKLLKASTTPHLLGASYTWFRDGVSILGAADSILPISQTGLYKVVVSNYGCIKFDTMRVRRDTAFKLNASSSHTSCAANIGSISLYPSGGTAPYQYIWNTTAQSKNISGLSSGSYLVTVSDTLGCKGLDTFKIEIKTSGITITPTITTKPLCPSSTNGAISLTVTGGKAPYTYLWTDGATTKNRIGLKINTYKVIVTDSVGCTDTSTIVLKSTDSIQLQLAKTLPCDRGGFILNATPLYGTAPYTYTWNYGYPNISTITVAFNNIVHRVTVTDGLGCQVKDTFVSKQPDSIVFLVSNRLSANIGVGKPFTGMAATDKIMRMNADSFMIDTNFTFTNCKFIFSTGGRDIKIVKKKTATFNSCKFYTCSNMGWLGINVSHESNIILLSSTIEDALIGLKINQSSDIVLQNNIFRNNLIGISFDPLVLNKTSRKVRVLKPFIGNQFLGTTTPLKTMNYSNHAEYLGYDFFNWPFAPAPNSTQRIPLNNLTPGLGSKSHTGIIMYNTDNMILGDNIPSLTSRTNKFENLNTGVAIRDAKTVVMQNFSFNNMEAVAVKSMSDERMYAAGWLPSYYTVGSFNTSLRQSTIANAPYGIINENGAFDVYQSNITNAYIGIQSVIGYAIPLSVNGSYIQASLKGIKSTHQSITPSFWFKDNTIVMNGTDYACNGLELNNVVTAGPKATCYIDGNNITLRGKAGYGFYINSIKDIQYELKNNAVSLAQVAPSNAINSYYKGGYLMYNSQLAVTNNSAGSYSRTALNTDFLPAQYPIGMLYSEVNGSISCNSVNTLRTGMLLSSGGDKASFQKNKFLNHFDGLKLDEFCRLPPQPNAGNTWKGSYLGGYKAKSGQIKPTVFKVGISPDSIYLPFPWQRIPMFGMFDNKGGIDNQTCTGTIGSGIPILISDGNGRTSDIITGKVSYQSYSMPQVYQDEKQLYTDLKAIEAQLPDTSLEKLFVDALDTTTTAEFVEIAKTEEDVMDVSASQESQIKLWKENMEGIQTYLISLDSILGSTEDSATRASLEIQIAQVQANRSVVENSYHTIINGEKTENLDDIVALKSTNASLVPEIVTDSLQKVFNELYYSTFAQENFRLTDEQILGYKALAHQCPLLNTDVVYRSRAVMAAYEDTVTYDDYVICMERGLEYKNKPNRKPVLQVTKKEIKCYLTPNPTDKYAKLQFSEIPIEDMMITISDMNGKLIYTDKQTLSMNLYEINTTQYVSGIYLVQVKLGSDKLYNFKLEVIKN